MRRSPSRSGACATAGEDAAPQVEVVFQPHAHMAAEQNGRGGERHLIAADGEGGEVGARRQRLHARLQDADLRWRTPGDAVAELEQRRFFKQALLQHLLAEPQMDAGPLASVWEATAQRYANSAKRTRAETAAKPRIQ